MKALIPSIMRFEKAVRSATSAKHSLVMSQDIPHRPCPCPSDEITSCGCVRRRLPQLHRFPGRESVLGSGTGRCLDVVAVPGKRAKLTEKNGFVTATKLGTTNNFFVAATKNFAAATKRFVDGLKHFVVVTKYFCYPYFNR